MQAASNTDSKEVLEGEVRELRKTLCQNVGLAANKAEKYDVTIKYCTQALYIEIYSVKALYLRSLAHMKLLQWKDAVCDAQLALQASPKDKVLA